MASISVSRARATLPDLIDRVLAGEEITITRHGRPVAIVMHPDAVRARRAGDALAEADHLREIMDRGRTARLDDAPAIPAERVDALLADVEHARSRR